MQEQPLPNTQMSINTNFDEKLARAYIGNNNEKIYESIQNGGINIYAILFGASYYAYRKVYTITILIIIVSMFVGLFASYVSNLVGLVVGLAFYPIYTWDVTRKLNKIKKCNLNTSETELISKATKKGGTSIISAILVFLFYLVYTLFIFIVLMRHAIG